MSGNVELARLARVVDELPSWEGAVSYQLDGSLGRDGECFVVVTIDAPLVMTCQRCLEPCAQTVSGSTRFLVIHQGDPLPEDIDQDDELEVLEAVGSVDVAALVEDELLLALPLSPRHDDCFGIADAADAVASAAIEISPFAGLARLKAPT